MRPVLLTAIVLLTGFLGAACGGASSDVGVCPQSAPAASGADPTCPEGCEWSGKECRKTRGIIVPQAPADATAEPAKTSSAP